VRIFAKDFVKNIRRSSWITASSAVRQKPSSDSARGALADEREHAKREERQNGA